MKERKGISFAGLFAVLSGAAALILFHIVMFIVGYVEITQPGRLDQDVSLDTILMYVFFSCLALCSIGLILGSVGMIQKKKGRLLPIAGIGLSIFPILLTALLIVYSIYEPF